MRISYRCVKFGLTSTQAGKYSLGHKSLNDLSAGDNQKDIVDLGIALQQRSNTMSAVEYMRSQGVNHVVIERVLTEPGRRRSWNT
jgi:hypothetical protein